MAGFHSSRVTHPQSSHSGGVDVETADPPPATSSHVALDIPEPVHSSGARHPQSSHGGGVDVESSADPPPASSHVALDIPEPVHQSDDRAVVVQEDTALCLCCIKVVYVLATVYWWFMFILWGATTKMTWQVVLAAVMVGVSLLLFSIILVVALSDKQTWEEAPVETSNT